VAPVVQPGRCNCADGYLSLNDGDAIEYTVGSGRGGPSCARPRHEG
jgi:cold shock CspA family protein